MLRIIISLLICFSLSCGLPSPNGGVKTLVLLESKALETSHKMFFDSLTARGFQLNFKIQSTQIKITEYEEPLYDNIILFAPKAADFGGELSTLNLIEFMKKGGNILVAGGPQTGAAVKDLVFEFGIEIDEKGQVIDHFEIGPNDDGSHTLVLSKNVATSKAIFPTTLTKPVLFRGAAHRLKDNVLVFPLLGGNPTSFSGVKGQVVSAPFALGRETGLVSALQARNNARIVFSGSLELFSDSLFQDASGSNQAFAEAISAWTFQERGVLQVPSSTHHRAGETYTPANYIIKEDLFFTLDVQEWNGTTWRPFHANDMELEIKMLDPYIRTRLDSNGKGTFSKTVKLPDVYGVFTFQTHYQRLGYTFIHASYIVPVHPLWHNQYERFIGAAYPYYTASLSMMIGLFLFSTVFLFNKEPNTKKSKSE